MPPDPLPLPCSLWAAGPLYRQLCHIVRFVDRPCFVRVRVGAARTSNTGEKKRAFLRNMAAAIPPTSCSMFLLTRLAACLHEGAASSLNYNSAASRAPQHQAGPKTPATATTGRKGRREFAAAGSGAPRISVIQAAVARDNSKLINNDNENPCAPPRLRDPSPLPPPGHKRHARRYGRRGKNSGVARGATSAPTVAKKETPSTRTRLWIAWTTSELRLNSASALPGVRGGEKQEWRLVYPL